MEGKSYNLVSNFSFPCSIKIGICRLLFRIYMPVVRVLMPMKYIV